MCSAFGFFNLIIITMKTLFYNYNQNNSGGYFINDDEVGLSEYVIIEAENAKKAWKKMKSIIDSCSQNAWSFCGCCGERWSNWLDDEDGKEQPSIYDEPIDEAKQSMFRSEVFIHYVDGTFRKVILKYDK